MSHAGIQLPDYKRNMVYRRISKRLHALGLRSFEPYADLLQGPYGNAEIEHFVNALTTNKTEFFRENHHFAHLRDHALPEFQARFAREPTRKLRLWSAGCSSGQEAYSMAMVLAEALGGMAGSDARILATDIDTDMIRAGQAGRYSVIDTVSIPPVFRQKYFEPAAASSTDRRVSQKIRALVTFNRLNLHGPWPMTGLFDIVFCRNVIIYFDKPTQIRLFERIASQMHDGAYLYIGHSESLYKVTERFHPVGQGVYRKAG